MRYEITPKPKPRMTRADKWKQRPVVVAYRAFKDEVNRLGIQIPPAVRLVFIMPIPKSLSKRDKAARAGRPHQQVPDVDNLTKGLLDAVCDDDSYVWRTDAMKIWSHDGIGAIEIEEILMEDQR